MGRPKKARHFISIQHTTSAVNGNESRAKSKAIAAINDFKNPVIGQVSIVVSDSTGEVKTKSDTIPVTVSGEAARKAADPRRQILGERNLVKILEKRDEAGTSSLKENKFEDALCGLVRKLVINLR